MKKITKGNVTITTYNPKNSADMVESLLDELDYIDEYYIHIVMEKLFFKDYLNLKGVEVLQAFEVKRSGKKSKFIDTKIKFLKKKNELIRK